jgi:hypothetical protein
VRRPCWVRPRPQAWPRRQASPPAARSHASVTPSAGGRSYRSHEPSTGTSSTHRAR